MIDPDLVVNALVLPVMATCLHGHAISPHASCAFITAGHDTLGRHVELVLQGLVAA